MHKSFWATLEGRLIAMIEGCEDLPLRELNESTLAWVEMEYHRTTHSETRETPLNRFLGEKNVGRPSPSPSELKDAFRMEVKRRVRRSDASISVEGKRFEIPSQYRHLSEVLIHYARWDLCHLHLIDPRTGKKLSRIYPVDLGKNASGKRRPVTDSLVETASLPRGEIAPLLQDYIKEFSATGLPAPYFPKDEVGDDDEQ